MELIEGYIIKLEEGYLHSLSAPPQRKPYNTTEILTCVDGKHKAMFTTNKEHADMIALISGGEVEPDRKFKHGGRWS